MGATFPRLKTWIAETLYATDLNAEFNNILTNLTPAGVDDQSTNDAAMQATADPYPAAAIDKPTDLKGELERLRYVIAQITGETYWYIDPDQNISTAGTMTKANFTTPGQFTSSVATGTAPLVITSVTEVANLTPQQIGDGTNIIKTKIIDIGDWDMDASISVTVAHGLTATKIRSISAIVRTDDAAGAYSIDYDNSAGSLSKGINFDATNIYLTRKTSGPFDGTDFNATSFNRGWVTITYVA